MLRFINYKKKFSKVIKNNLKQHGLTSFRETKKIFTKEKNRIQSKLVKTVDMPTSNGNLIYIVYSTYQWNMYFLCKIKQITLK